MFHKKLFKIGWKLGLVVLVALTLVYYFRFAPIPVESRLAKMGPIVSEVMGTG